jgi:ArsR family transcriptional regulator
MASRNQRSEISFDELLVILKETEVTIIDVRPEREYLAGHIKGARSTPLAELESFIPELDSEREIVVYCRGSYSTLADKALKLLLEAGYHARRLVKGFPEWRAQGLPIEEGELAMSSTS